MYAALPVILTLVLGARSHCVYYETDSPKVTALPLYESNICKVVNKNFTGMIQYHFFSVPRLIYFC